MNGVERVISSFGDLIDDTSDLVVSLVVASLHVSVCVCVCHPPHRQHCLRTDCILVICKWMQMWHQWMDGVVIAIMECDGRIN